MSNFPNARPYRLPLNTFIFFYLLERAKELGKGYHELTVNDIPAMPTPETIEKIKKEK